MTPPFYSVRVFLKELVVVLDWKRVAVPCLLNV